MQKAESYQEIGGWLRQRREEYALDIHVIARDLHIRPRYLAALEEGNMGELPGVAYARGYLATYAGYLGLERERFVEVFDEIGHPSRRGFHLPANLGKQSKPQTGVILATLGATVLTAFYWAMSQQASLPVPLERMVPAASAQKGSVMMVPSPPRCAGQQELLFPPCYGRAEITVTRYLETSPFTSVVERSHAR